MTPGCAAVDAVAELCCELIPLFASRSRMHMCQPSTEAHRYYLSNVEVGWEGHMTGQATAAAEQTLLCLRNVYCSTLPLTWIWQRNCQAGRLQIP